MKWRSSRFTLVGVLHPSKHRHARHSGSFLLGETRGSGTAQSRKPGRPARPGRAEDAARSWAWGAPSPRPASAAGSQLPEPNRHRLPRPAQDHTVHAKLVPDLERPFTPSTGRRPLPCTLAADDDASTCSGALHIYIYTHSSSNSTYHCSRV